jgi:hypothetical protein
MKGAFSMRLIAFLACAVIFRIASAQISSASHFFNASGDTREVESSTPVDASSATNPSVPLGYPAPAPSAATPAAQQTPDPSVKNIEPRKAFISYSASTKMLTLVIPRSQNVRVSAHVLNGQSISRFSTRKFLTAGTHTIRLGSEALAEGIIVFSVEGEGFSLVKRINLTTDR